MTSDHLVSGPQHFVNLFVAQLLRQVGQDVSHLADGDLTGPLLVEHPVRLSDLVLRVGLLHLLHHHHLQKKILA